MLVLDTALFLLVDVGLLGGASRVALSLWKRARADASYFPNKSAFLYMECATWSGALLSRKT